MLSEESLPIGREKGAGHRVRISDSLEDIDFSNNSVAFAAAVKRKASYHYQGNWFTYYYQQ